MVSGSDRSVLQARACPAGSFRIASPRRFDPPSQHDVWLLLAMSHPNLLELVDAKQLLHLVFYGLNPERSFRRHSMHSMSVRFHRKEHDLHSLRPRLLLRFRNPLVPPLPLVVNVTLQLHPLPLRLFEPACRPHVLRALRLQRLRPHPRRRQLLRLPPQHRRGGARGEGHNRMRLCARLERAAQSNLFQFILILVLILIFSE
jgi:hypothetical protein